ncbi:MAG: MBG domain-containing protein, partial [Opitutaceae bacterium]|nr:MBG domain-containing protein [Opitutaceae bacterium]
MISVIVMQKNCRRPARNTRGIFAPARRLAALLLPAFLVLAAPARAAGDVTVPLPSVQWNPIESGTTIPSTGTRDGFALLTNDTLLLRKSTTTNFNTCAPGEFITTDGAGPFGVGRAFDFSANTSTAGYPTVDADPALASPISSIVSGFNVGGATGFTFTLWYKLDTTFSGNGVYTTLLRNNSTDATTGAFDVFFLDNGALRFVLAGDTANAAGSTAYIQSGVSTTLTQPGAWVFLAGTWDGANGFTTLYCGTETLEVSRLRDGTVNTKGALRNSALLNVAYHNIATTSNNGRTLDGWMADIRLYSEALTPEQIEKIRAGSASSTVTTYLPTVKSWTDTALASTYTDAQVDTATAPGSIAHDRVFHIAAAARLWLLGGKTEPAYADKAFYILNALRSQRNATPGWRISFQAKFSFAEACSILIQNGYAGAAFDAACKDDLKAMARDSLGPAEVADNNVGAFSAAGTVQALALWPDLDAGGAWTDYIKQQWASWTALHDTAENSLNYNKAFLAYSVLMTKRAAGISGLNPAAMLADLDHAGTKAMVTRWRDQVAGGGSLPAYGDDGNGTPMPALDNWPLDFEWAAKQWHDPSFRWAANAVWRLTRNSATREPMVLLLLTYADEWGDLSVEPVQPATGSLLQTRATVLAANEPDKIILAPSRDSGAPFTAAEIHAHGWHSHTEQIGSITHHEHQNNIFLYGLGYNNRSSDQASMVLINPASMPFPWRGYPQNNTWYEAAIPTDRFPLITSTAHPLYNGGGRRLIDTPLWRVEQHNPTTPGHAWLSDYRLVAAGGAETVLNPLNNTSGWGGSLNATLAAGPTGEAGAALRFDVAPQVTQNGSTFITLPSSQRVNRGVLPAEHPLVKFWWKVDVPATSGINPDDSIMAHRQDYYDGGEHMNGAIAWLQPFSPATTAANVETAAGGRYGSLSVDGYFTLGTKLDRRMVQLDDGTLVVLDTLLPDADADGRNAGPVWQLDAGAQPAQVAPGVFDATGFFNTRTLSRGTARLLVVMERAPGREFGSQRPPSPLWANTNPYATFARSTLRAGVPASFVTVLLPNDGATAATALASRVRIQRNAPDSVVVQIDRPGGATSQVTLGANDTWGVTEIATPQPATITLGGLVQAYDGTPKPVSVTTAPSGLSAIVTYGEERTLTAPTEIGSYSVTAQITAPGYYGETTGTLLVRAPTAYIMEQPLPRVVAAGGTVTFSVVASGRAPISYQWEKSADGLGGFSAVGANSDTLTLSGAQTSDAGFYRVTATNELGSDTSVVVELAVIPAAFPAPKTDGYGASATGGGDTPDILVSTESELREYAALDTPAVLTLRGNIALGGGGALVVGSDKTIQGIDSAATLSGGLQIGPGADNVVVRGLNISNPAPGGAGLAVTGATDVFVSHVSVFSGTDSPLVSIDATSDNITLAWSEFYFTGTDGARSAMLAGGAGVASPSHISLHHNLWQDAGQDMPLATNSRAHLYSNYFTATGNLATITVGNDAQ